MKRRGSAAALCAALVFVGASAARAGDYYILETEEARTVGQGNLRTEVQAGVRKQNDASELYNVPRVRAEYGLSDWADLEFEYDVLIVQDTDIPNYDFDPVRFAYNEDHAGSGDLRVRLKMVPFNTAFGDVGLHIETKLPNADDRDGLGTDSMDVTGKLLHSVDWSRFTDAPILRDITTHANVGIAIQS